MGLLNFLKKDKAKETGNEDIDDLNLPPLDEPSDLKLPPSDFPPPDMPSHDEQPGKKEDIPKEQKPLNLGKESTQEFAPAAPPDLPPPPKFDDSLDQGHGKSQNDSGIITIPEPPGDLPPVVEPKKSDVKPIPIKPPEELFQTKEPKVKEFNQPDMSKLPDFPHPEKEGAVSPEPMRFTEPAKDEFAIPESIADDAEKFADNHFVPRTLHNKPIFVNLDKYSEVLDFTDSIKKDLQNSEQHIFQINELKNQKDKEFENWHDTLEEIQRKIVHVDKTFFKE